MSQKKGLLTIQCDEMWSFVQCKENKQWLWFALDVESREIVGAVWNFIHHYNAEMAPKIVKDTTTH